MNQEEKPFKGIDHGTKPIDLTHLDFRVSAEYMPIEIHHKINGAKGEKPSFCIVGKQYINSAYMQISLEMLNEGLKEIGYKITKT